MRSARARNIASRRWARSGPYTSSESSLMCPPCVTCRVPPSAPHGRPVPDNTMRIPRRRPVHVRPLRRLPRPITLRRRLIGALPIPGPHQRGAPSSMAKKRAEPRRMSTPTPFEQARDELFSHILRCGVLEASAEHQKEWFDDTMLYLADRYDGLDEPQLTELRVLGERYCRPVVARSATVGASVCRVAPHHQGGN